MTEGSVKIDLQALNVAATGDPEKLMTVNKAWVKAVVQQIEVMHPQYDTSALRVMTLENAPDRPQVAKRWLRHIHTTLLAKPTPARARGNEVEMSPEQEKHFDAAMLYVDRAVSHLARAFSKR